MPEGDIDGGHRRKYAQYSSESFVIHDDSLSVYRLVGKKTFKNHYSVFVWYCQLISNQLSMPPAFSAIFSFGGEEYASIGE